MVILTTKTVDMRNVRYVPGNGNESLTHTSLLSLSRQLRPPPPNPPPRPPPPPPPAHFVNKIAIYGQRQKEGAGGEAAGGGGGGEAGEEWEGEEETESKICHVSVTGIRS